MSIGYLRPDEQVVDELLAEVDPAGAEELRPLLLELRSITGRGVPIPSAELAAVLHQNVAPLRPRRRGTRRALVVTLAVVTTMGLGVGTAAAAIPEFRTAAQDAITGLFTSITRGHPAPASPAKPLAPQPSRTQQRGASPSMIPTPISGPFATPPSSGRGRGQGQGQGQSGNDQRVRPRPTPLPHSDHSSVPRGLHSPEPAPSR
ncbi:hypothetical protein [Parafrigoribacterium soli]|uniref:hypothetical protein n=1 Tax=Parafrigoribacterium soli TaxID=3144663 RepID=UPI0032EB1BF0